jgi:hypothetical protein
MNKLKEKLKGISGIEIKLTQASLAFVKKLPVFLNKAFNFYAAEIEGKKIVLVEILSVKNFTPDRLKKQQYQLEDFSQSPIVFLIEHIEAYQRKRLVEKKIPFIVPAKQLYIPNLFIDLNEVRRGNPPVRRERLSPAAQCVLLYHLQVKSMNELPLKVIAKNTGYSCMTISRVAKELKQFSICNITGTKEKALVFSNDKKETWDKLLDVFQSPVKQKYFANQISASAQLLQAGESAMEHYTHLVANKTKTFAVSKEDFSVLKKMNAIKDLNQYEGDFLIEVWIYNPVLLSKSKYVDPLSLYLSMKDSTDDRTQIELEKLLNNMKW